MFRSKGTAHIAIMLTVIIISALAIVAEPVAPGQKAYAALEASQSRGGDPNSGWAYLWLIAQLIHAEAANEPYAGKVAVGAVVLNRVASPNFPNTVPGVIYEPYAFTPVYDGRINLPPDSESLRAAQDALRGWDPSYGALYFYNPAKSTSWWVFTRPITTQIGNHVFAR